MKTTNLLKSLGIIVSKTSISAITFLGIVTIGLYGTHALGFETIGLFVNSEGKVGIGTDTPTQELDVSGSITASGTITVGSSYTLPATDGDNNQVLKTNGAGTLSWSDTNGNKLKRVDNGTWTTVSLNSAGESVEYYSPNQIEGMGNTVYRVYFEKTNISQTSTSTISFQNIGTASVVDMNILGQLGGSNVYVWSKWATSNANRYHYLSKNSSNDITVWLGKDISGVKGWVDYTK